MAVFSRRNGYNTVAIQLERASDTLKRRIMATFYKLEFEYHDFMSLYCSPWVFNKVLQKP